ncbi:Eco57I restriction-modification methylase domain-containing protein [Streptomyces sp. NPDC055254]
MRTIDQVSADKLRGGFYSPEPLVATCFERVRELLDGNVDGLKVLEPSAGDGAFVRGLQNDPLASRVSEMVAVEIDGVEAAHCEEAGQAAPFSVDVRQGSFLAPQRVVERDFDVAVGNPPFVRFQFVSNSERTYSDAIAAELGVTFKGVSNLWIPMLLSALSKLRDGGVFAFIIPAECLTGISASVIRRWVLQNSTSLRVDLFAPGSFPGVLQEVVILSGRRSLFGGDALLEVRETGGPSVRVWSHHATADAHTWTRYLLNPRQVEALDAASDLPLAGTVGQFARFSVATVTGANDYFSASPDMVKDYDLEQWAIPLLPRIRNAKGLVFTRTDQRQNAEEGIRSHLLDFSRGDDPMEYPLAAEYIRQGEAQELHLRYKCRIRSPWYHVPVVAPGALLMSKRSHFYPRVVANEVSAVTTDTIYQARMLPGATKLARAFAGSFHNSLTLLSAEIEGRSFGGGVLELVPSEVSRLQVIVHEAMEGELPLLDDISRSEVPGVEDLLVEETDRRLCKVVPGLEPSLLEPLAEARLELQKRRLDRTKQSA